MHCGAPRGCCVRQYGMGTAKAAGGACLSALAAPGRFLPLTAILVFPVPPAAAKRLVQPAINNLPAQPTPVACPAPTRSETGLEFMGDLTGHTDRITDVRFDLPDEPHLVHTSSGDGSVRGWDARTGQQVEG